MTLYQQFYWLIWIVKDKLKANPFPLKFQIKCAISQCLFSPSGQYLAGSTVAGQIAVWEVDTGSCIGVIEHPTSHNVSSMVWHPKGWLYCFFLFLN